MKKYENHPLCIVVAYKTYGRMWCFGGYMEKVFSYFTKFEIALWSSSVAIILVSFFAFDRANYMTLIASLVGVTSLIFCAKGNPIGEVLMIVFSILYGIISYSFAYYGEMITYLGMTLPMSVIALISWLRNPYSDGKAEVKVNSISIREQMFMWLLTAIVTFVFSFVLKYFGTANLVPSTVSVMTSFAAAYLTFRRSPYLSLAYAANDLILIVLWVLASLSEIRYIAVVGCFSVFFFNDIYGFVNWQRMKKRQSEIKTTD